VPEEGIVTLAFIHWADDDQHSRKVEEHGRIAHEVLHVEPGSARVRDVRIVESKARASHVLWLV
jgi:predicted hydrolase (HD superfamily)